MARFVTDRRKRRVKGRLSSVDSNYSSTDSVLYSPPNNDENVTDVDAVDQDEVREMDRGTKNSQSVDNNKTSFAGGEEQEDGKDLSSDSIQPPSSNKKLPGVKRRIVGGTPIQPQRGEVPNDNDGFEDINDFWAACRDPSPDVAPKNEKEGKEGEKQYPPKNGKEDTKELQKRMRDEKVHQWREARLAARLEYEKAVQNMSGRALDGIRTEETVSPSERASVGHLNLGSYVGKSMRAKMSGARPGSAVEMFSPTALSIVTTAPPTPMTPMPMKINTAVSSVMNSSSDSRSVLQESVSTDELHPEIFDENDNSRSNINVDDHNNVSSGGSIVVGENVKGSVEKDEESVKGDEIEHNDQDIINSDSGGGESNMDIDDLEENNMDTDDLFPIVEEEKIPDLFVVAPLRNENVDDGDNWIEGCRDTSLEQTSKHFLTSHNSPSVGTKKLSTFTPPTSIQAKIPSSLASSLRMSSAKKKRGGDMITPPLENTIEEMLNNTCDTEDNIETGLDAESSIDKLEGTKDSIEHGKTLPETSPLINGSNDNDLADENSGDYIHDDSNERNVTHDNVNDDNVNDDNGDNDDNDDNGYNGGNDDNDDNDDNDNDFDNNDDNDGQGYQMVSSSSSGKKNGSNTSKSSIQDVLKSTSLDEDSQEEIVRTPQSSNEKEKKGSLRKSGRKSSSKKEPGFYTDKYVDGMIPIENVRTPLSSQRKRAGSSSKKASVRSSSRKQGEIENNSMDELDDEDPIISSPLEYTHFPSSSPKKKVRSSTKKVLSSTKKVRGTPQHTPLDESDSEGSININTPVSSTKSAINKRKENSAKKANSDILRSPDVQVENNDSILSPREKRKSSTKKGSSRKKLNDDVQYQSFDEEEANGSTVLTPTEDSHIEENSSLDGSKNDHRKKKIKSSLKKNSEKWKSPTQKRVTYSSQLPRTAGYPCANREYDGIAIQDITPQQNNSEMTNNRRSRRTRFAPLKFWKNERCVYGVHEEKGELGAALGKMPVVKKVMKALPTPMKKRMVRHVYEKEKRTKNGENKASEGMDSKEGDMIFDYNKLCSVSLLFIFIFFIRMVNLIFILCIYLI